MYYVFLNKLPFKFLTQKIQALGGGIHFTTKRTREASEDELLNGFIAIANAMLRSGTTLLEAKSGYGLDLDSELKMLKVLQRASQKTSVEISGTVCAAHAVPKGSTEERQTKLIVSEILPAIRNLKEQKQLSIVENIGDLFLILPINVFKQLCLDVFCEKGVFSLENRSLSLITALS